jgi:hypothetical protein
VYMFNLGRWCVLLDVRVSGSLDQILNVIEMQHSISI